MQSNKDRQVILLEKMAHACLVSEWIPAPCGAALAKHSSEIAWVVQSCLSSPALGSMETTSAMELCAKSLTCSDNVERMQRLGGWTDPMEAQVWETISSFMFAWALAKLQFSSDVSI